MSNEDDRMIEGQPRRGRPPKSASLRTEPGDRDLDSRERPEDDDRELSDADRLALFESEESQAHLPSIPEIPGYHICYVSTQHRSDTPHWRRRLGYSFVTRADLPKGYGFGGVVDIKLADYGDVLGVNEMVAMKIRIDLYEKLMRIAHHKRPLQQEESVREKVDAMARALGGQGSRLIPEEGMSDLVSRTPREPTFAE